VNFTLEGLAPIPGADRTLRGSLFVDGGQVWGDNQKAAFADLRYSVGLGLGWVSPIGPLKLSYAYPLKTKPTDRLQRFQFQIGTTF
jgi:outer membrane protein insertion porin family